MRDRCFLLLSFAYLKCFLRDIHLVGHFECAVSDNNHFETMCTDASQGGAYTTYTCVDCLFIIIHSLSFALEKKFVIEQIAKTVCE